MKLSLFESVIQNMISEKREYRRIKNNRFIRDFKQKHGECPQSVKEFVDKYGAKGYQNLNKIKNLPIPRQFFIYNVIIISNYGLKDYVQVLTSEKTFEDALIAVYNNINFLKNDVYNRKEYSTDIEAIGLDSDKDSPVEIILKVNRQKGIFSRCEYTVYKIDKTIITIHPESTFIVPDYNKTNSNERNVKVYEL